MKYMKKSREDGEENQGKIGEVVTSLCVSLETHTRRSQSQTSVLVPDDCYYYRYYSSICSHSLRFIHFLCNPPQICLCTCSLHFSLILPPKSFHFFLQSPFQFDSHDSHQQVMIQWAGEGSDVIVCVTRDAHQTLESQTSVLVSDDYGSTYVNHTHQFKTKEGKPAIINKFYKNDKFTNTVSIIVIISIIIYYHYYYQYY